MVALDAEPGLGSQITGSFNSVLSSPKPKGANCLYTCFTDFRDTGDDEESKPEMARLLSMLHGNATTPKRQPMNDKVLYEVERWFRAKLRGDTLIHSHEVELFRALAEWQNERADAYLPRATAAPRSPIRAPTSDVLSTTILPPPDVQAELVRISKGPVGPGRRRG